MKLNSQLGVQNDQINEMSELFLKRRWLNYIKQGVSILQDRRKMRHKASIFRFLAVQRKAYNSLVKFCIQRQEVRIKKEFAMQLYYKRILDTGFTSLKVYREYA